MTLKLTDSEVVLLQDSIETRQIKILGLIREFREDKYMTEDNRDFMITAYQDEYELLTKLLNRLRNY
jgi:hypothetical protein